MMKLLMLLYVMAGLMVKEKSMTKTLFCRNSLQEERKAFGQNEISNTSADLKAKGE
jgi:hypothetical protein